MPPPKKHDRNRKKSRSSFSKKPGPPKPAKKPGPIREQTEVEGMRLNKYVAHCGICSRRQAADHVKNGQVTVNGQVERAPGYQVQEGDEIRYKGELIRPEERKVYLLLNKPRGYITTNDIRNFPGGGTLEVDVRLFTAEELTRYERKWDAWIPYVVLGVGIAIPAAGSGIHVASKNNFDDFDAGIEACGGCTREDDPALFDLETKADRQQRAAIALYAVGGAAIVAGSVLAYVNRARAYRIDEKQQQPGGVSLAPFIGRDATGVTASFRF